MVIRNWQFAVKEKVGAPNRDQQPTTYHASRVTRHASRFTFHVSRFLLPLGLFLAGLGGAFAPWIWRESVALQLTGPGLAEFVKFLPEIRTGQIQIERLYFLLPLWLAMLMLPLVVANQRLALPAWLRWLLRLAVIPMALASLSPVWTPTILMDTEFRLQTLLAGAAVGLAVIAPLLKRLPFKTLVVPLIVGGSIAVILPFWHFSLVQASISSAYSEPISLGWGWWLTVVGIVLSMVGGVWVAFLVQNHESKQSV